jgi:zinc D-Ala-D-Ala carboxypeptidase
MKTNSLVWAAVAAFFIFRSKDAQASFMPSTYGTTNSGTGAEILPNMLEEGGFSVIDPMQDYSMTPNFTLSEFTQSKTAVKRGIDNTLPPELQNEAFATLSMMENIRAYLSDLAGHEVRIYISSGYRTPELNAAIGGDPKSDHMKAAAVDWTAPDFGTPIEVAKALQANMDNLGIGQLINEFPSSRSPWIHTSTKTPELAINKVITITAQGAIPGVVQA